MKAIQSKKPQIKDFQVEVRFSPPFGGLSCYSLCQYQVIEPLFVILLWLAFILKLISVIALVFHIVTVDLFLIDWESPIFCRRRGRLDKIGPSIWRSYNIIRRLTTIIFSRRLSVVLRLSLTVIVMEFIFRRSATASDSWWPVGSIGTPPSHPEYISPDNVTLRFPCIVLTYIIIGQFQKCVCLEILSCVFY